MNDRLTQNNPDTASLVLPIHAKNDLAALNHLTELLVDLYPNTPEDRRNDDKYLALLGRVRELCERLDTIGYVS